MTAYFDISIKENRVAFYIPLNKWVYYAGGKWNLDSPVDKESLPYHLFAVGWTPTEVTTFAKSKETTLVVHGQDLVPNQPIVYKAEDGLYRFNSWVKPTIEPTRGEFPTIAKVLDFFAAGDVKSRAWLEQFIAYKVQDPLVLPKVAAVFTSEPGGGKGFLGRVVSAILGEENCAVIQRGELVRTFNSRWITKLFVLADEVLSSENLQDVSQRLKVLIDGYEQEIEGKYKNQKAIRNKIQWFFASNDAISPLALERGDRRYSVFSRTDEIDPVYRAALDACFERDRVTLTPEFRREVAGFAYYLLNDVKVDPLFVTRPCETPARTSLIEANQTSYDSFFSYAEEHGLQPYIERLVLLRGNRFLNSEDWDFPAESAVSTQALYAMYGLFCEDVGQKPLKLPKFGAAIRTRTKWEPRKLTAKGGRRVNCYVVPRKQRAEVSP